MDGVVTLDAAALEDATLLANLLELYQHDLSAAFQVDVGADGRFGYDKLPLYWSEPQRRFPYLIRSDNRIAGFAFATLGSPASDDPTMHDVAEFFVLRKHRRGGIGARAAHLLFDRHPGPWSVRVFERNRGALEFWNSAIAAYVSHHEHEQRGEWHIFRFGT